jgi:sarcosine oxidase
VEQCVVAHAEEAVRRGAELHTGEAIAQWRSDGHAFIVQTDRDTYTAQRLVIAAGAWTND